MAFKTILTVTSPDSGNGDLQLAAGLCAEIDAHLAVLVLAVAPPPPIGEYAAVISNGWLEERRDGMEALRKRAEDITALFGSGPVSTDIVRDYPEQAATDDVIGRRARYTDLLVLGPDLLSDPVLSQKAIEGALFLSGKPLLLVPKGAAATLKPKRVVVAWDSRIEASKAMARALHLLRGADVVHLVLVDPLQGDDAQGAEPGADAATYLARHGAKVTVDRLPGLGYSVAAILRQHCVDTAADLLVMGGYGHSRLRERIFGGVTKSIIDDLPLPVLMAR